MEERTKKMSLENIYEDINTLRLKQHKLILEKKEMSKKFETNRMLRSDHYQQMTHWDIVLMELKYASLDMFEQRKWKKGIYYVLSNQAETKLKKLNRKKKLDELYKKCMCLYLSMNINNNLTDISMGKVNHNMTEQLNSYIKTVSNVEYLNKQFAHWKDSLADIKAKLQKKFGEKNMSKAKNFLRVIDVMENMINLQEQAIKNLIQKDEAKMDIDQPLSQPSFSLNELNSSEILNQSKFKELDLNTLSKELNIVIEEIVNEINSQDDSDIFLEMNTSYENVVTFTGSSQLGQEKMQIDKTSLIQSHNKLESPTSTKLYSENDLIMNINPKQLFYDISSSNKNSDELKIYLEKVLKVEHEKIDVLPNYNYSKILSTPVDINKDIDNFTKVYFKVFPSIYFNDDYSLDKEILESEIDLYKNKYEKILKDYEHNKLFNFKFNNFTTLQKLILIWGLCTYGTNLHILNEIPNIFTFTKSISYDDKEIFIELDKLLSEMNIDFLASNFDSISLNNKSSPLIYMLDPPMLNSTQCSFYYNKKILNLVKLSRRNEKSENPEENKMDVDDYNGIDGKTRKKKEGHHYLRSSSWVDSLNCLNTFNLQINWNWNQNKSLNNSSRINLIVNSPIFRSIENKKQMLKNLKEDLIKICTRVESLYEGNKINNSKFDYYNMTKKQVETAVNGKSTGNTRKTSSTSNNNTVNTSAVVEPQNILINLSNADFDFGVKKFSDYILDATRPNVRQDTLEGVSFFSQQSIQKEWEILRSPWYQNNIQFKPKFRKPVKMQPQQMTNQSNGVGVNPYQAGANLNILRNLNDNRSN